MINFVIQNSINLKYKNYCKLMQAFNNKGSKYIKTKMERLQKKNQIYNHVGDCTSLNIQSNKPENSEDRKDLTNIIKKLDLELAYSSCICYYASRTYIVDSYNMIKIEHTLNFIINVF